MARLIAFVFVALIQVTIAGRARTADLIDKDTIAEKYDVVVIGGGPTGVKAAIAAASQRRSVAIVDPKLVLHGAPTGMHSKGVREAVVNCELSWEQVNMTLERALDRMQKVTSKDLQMFNVDHIQGFARIRDTQSIEVRSSEGFLTELTFDSLVIASGSSANRFPPLDFGVAGIFDSDTIADLDRIPKSLLVQGGGIIGLEYALIFAKLGARVTVVEFFNKILSMLDSSLQEACMKILSANGIKIFLNTTISKVRMRENHSVSAPSLMVETTRGDFECDTLLAATGRHGNTADLNLAALAQKKKKTVKVGRGRFVEVDENGWTGVDGIYAVGDVAGASLATAGQAQAVRAVMALTRRNFQQAGAVNKHMPSCVWSIPEMGWAGLTEEQAADGANAIGIAIATYSHTVKGALSGEQGFLKILYQQDSGKLVGVHVFGENSCEIVNYGADIINRGETCFDIIHFVFPAVTYHQLYHYAATKAVRSLLTAKEEAATKEDVDER